MHIRCADGVPLRRGVGKNIGGKRRRETGYGERSLVLFGKLRSESVQSDRDKREGGGEGESG